MYIIGLTGNIATGKSTVAHMLHDLGAAVIDADRVAHAVMAPGGEAWAGVREAFPGVIAADGTVDRQALGTIVFADPEALARLEAIVHPAVGRALMRQLEALRAQPEPPRVVVVEAIKLLEGGLASLCDAVWLVVAPRAVQVARLLQTRGLTPEEAAARIDAQPPAEPKRALADVVIVNDGSLDDLWAQVREAWQKIPQ